MRGSTVTVDSKKETLVVPITAMVDLGGRRGVFTPLPENTAAFRVVQVGVETGDAAEIIAGLQEGDRVITTGAAALRDGDRIVLPGGAAGGRGRRGNGQSAGAGVTSSGGAAGAAAPGATTGQQAVGPAAAANRSAATGDSAAGAIPDSSAAAVRATRQAQE